MSETVTSSVLVQTEQAASASERNGVELGAESKPLENENSDAAYHC